MARYEFLTQSGHPDLLVEVGFDTLANTKDIVRILHLVLELLESKIISDLELFLEGITMLGITEKILRIVFRFSTLEHLESSEQEEIAHRRTHFIFHLFAKVDNYHKLRDTPFPSDFRSWLDLSDEYDLDEGK